MCGCDRKVCHMRTGSSEPFMCWPEHPMSMLLSFKPSLNAVHFLLMQCRGDHADAVCRVANGAVANSQTEQHGCSQHGCSHGACKQTQQTARDIHERTEEGLLHAPWHRPCPSQWACRRERLHCDALWLLIRDLLPLLRASSASAH